MFMLRTPRPALALVLAACFALPALALDADQVKKGNAVIAEAVAYLRSTQKADGSWSAEAGPAVTALIVNALIDQPNIDADDPAVRKGYEYLLDKQKPDGGIHDGILGNYNTSIALSALSRLVDPQNPPKQMTPLQKRALEAIKKGEQYIRGLQYAGGVDENGKPIGPDHPFFGGVGYGKHGRPDGSNTQFFVQALMDMNIDCKDPAVVRAVQFFSALQGSDANKKFGDQIVKDGGAIYATSIDKDRVGVPQSQASPEQADEGKAGKPVSGLRTYGSMTYAMFKTYIYAQLPPDDQRVTDAAKWISRNYTMSRNPGMSEGQEMQGYYYYLVTMARALDAWASINARYLEDQSGKRIDWAGDMIDVLAEKQRDDGSFVNEADRWMEGDPNLVTGYALIALTQAMRQR
jgi:squalene-hopene/tetraprenyl-beta-curcumene cyclase